MRNSSLAHFHKLLQSARCAVVIGVRAQQLCRGPIPALWPYGSTLRMPYKAGRACRQLWAERVDRLLREDPDGLPHEPASSKGRMPGPGISLRAAVGYRRYSPAACRLRSDVACKVMPRVLLNTALVYASTLGASACSVLHGTSFVSSCTHLLLSGATASDQLTSPRCAEILPFPDLGDEKESLKQLTDKIKASGKTPIDYFTGDMPLYTAAGDTLVHDQ